MLLGIDVSDYQGQVDWPSVANSGRQFAFAKATEGVDFVCQTFTSNWAGIKAAGMVRGAYHFARPNQNAPETEADWFLEHVGTPDTGDLLVLDLEAGDGDLANWTLTWLRRVAAHVGFRPLLYSGTWFLEPHGCTGNADLAEHGMWLASYQATMPPPPGGWSFISFWQHTDRATVPGVSGGCDESFFSGDPAHLSQYGKPSGAGVGSPGISVPTPPPPASAPNQGDYVVRSADTLGAIAAACSCSVADLLRVNPQISDPNQIAVGQAIHLPPRSGSGTTNGRTYVVRSGDSLGAIASRLEVSFLALERANPQIVDPNQISVGESLQVPSS